MCHNVDTRGRASFHHDGVRECAVSDLSDKISIGTIVLTTEIHANMEQCTPICGDGEGEAMSFR